MGPFVLGMSLEQARALKLTEVNGTENGKLLCAGDKNAPSALEHFSTQGSVVCIVGTDILNWGLRLGDRLISKPMLIFNSGELIEVQATFSMDDAARVRAAIAQRFGDPASSEQGETHNRLGSAIPQLEVKWVVGGDEITLTAPSGKIDEFSVDYRNRAAADALDRAYSSEKAKATGL